MSEPESKLAYGFWEKFFVVFLVVGCFLIFVRLAIIPYLLHRNEITPAQISPANVCINNLLKIDVAANQFALENHLTNGDRINYPNDLTPYIKLNREGKIPSCPSGGIYRISRVGEYPTCSLGTTVTLAHVLP